MQLPAGLDLVDALVTKKRHMNFKKELCQSQGGGKIYESKK